jgi:glutamate-ammonia-ligase adenylyltransferase
MRNLEHRLQLLNSFQVQNLPDQSNSGERTRVALRMGYASLNEFESELARHRSQVHDALNRILYSTSTEPDRIEQEGEWQGLSSLLDNLDTPAAREKVSEMLSKHGFRDIPAALHALQLPMSGNEFGEMPPDTPELFKHIAPDLLARCSRSASPDAALSGIETIALAVPNRAQLYASFNESADLLDRLVRLAAGSPHLLKRLSAHLEWIEAVLSPDLRTDRDASPRFTTLSPTAHNGEGNNRILNEMRRRIARSTGLDLAIDAISSIFQREALIIGAMEIWEDIDSAGAAHALTVLADATLQSLVELCTANLLGTTDSTPGTADVLSTVAFIGLGKLGGAELGYASDWDLLAVHQPRLSRSGRLSESDCARLAEELVARVTEAAQKLVTRGAHIEIDLRLRPWGKKGSLSPSLRSYVAYYRKSAETWERQAGLKARFVAGNRRVGLRLVRVLHAVSFGGGLSAAEDSEVIAMKKRIELERLDPENRYADLKLGLGGLMDIEWIAQRLQMKHGRSLYDIRWANTILALSALADCSLLDNSEADYLIESYNLLARVRNTMWLQKGRSQDVMPSSLELRHTLARQLGYGGFNMDVADENMLNDITTHMREVRAIFERRFAAQPG